MASTSNRTAGVVMGSAGKGLWLAMSCVAGGRLTAGSGSWDSSFRKSRESGRLSSNHAGGTALECPSCVSIWAMRYRALKSFFFLLSK